MPDEKDEKNEKKEQKPAETAPVTAEAAAGAAPAEGEAGAAPRRTKAAKGKAQRHIPSGVVHIEASFNNTKVTVTDHHGNVISWCTGGRLGFKGSRKSTAYVAQQVGADAVKRAVALGLREAEVNVCGPGAGRESAVRGVAAAGIEISVLRDVTPIPHNGCRPPKRRRV